MCVGVVAGASRSRESDPELVVALERLVAEDCRGDPMQVLLWTSKSVRRLAGELREQGHEVHFTTVARAVALARVQPAVQSQERWRAPSIPIATRSFG